MAQGDRLKSPGISTAFIHWFCAGTLSSFRDFILQKCSYIFLEGNCVLSGGSKQVQGKVFLGWGGVGGWSSASATIGIAAIPVRRPPYTPTPPLHMAISERGREKWWLASNSSRELQILHVALKAGQETNVGWRWGRGSLACANLVALETRAPPCTFPLGGCLPCFSASKRWKGSPSPECQG